MHTSKQARKLADWIICTHRRQDVSGSGLTLSLSLLSRELAAASIATLPLHSRSISADDQTLAIAIWWQNGVRSIFQLVMVLILIDDNVSESYSMPVAAVELARENDCDEFFTARGLCPVR